jgi:hypothetical protein
VDVEHVCKMNFLNVCIVFMEFRITKRDVLV